MNLTFTEPSVSDFDIIRNNRAILAEICFEKLKVHSISFQKSASLHLFSDLKMNGIVVDLGAQYTQISPVSDGYTSLMSSKFFRVTGNKLDYYLYKRLLSNYSLDSKYHDESNNISLFQVKRDLKETSFSPYKNPVNMEVLSHKIKLDPNNPNSYKEYILPDGKTLIPISQERGSINFIQELIDLYFDSSKLAQHWQVYDIGFRDDDDSDYSYLEQESS